MTEEWHLEGPEVSISFTYEELVNLLLAGKDYPHIAPRSVDVHGETMAGKCSKAYNNMTPTNY